MTALDHHARRGPTRPRGRPCLIFDHPSGATPVVSAEVQREQGNRASGLATQHLFTLLAPGTVWNNTFYNNTAPSSSQTIVTGADFQNNIAQSLSGNVSVPAGADYNDYFDNGPDDNHSSEAHSLFVDARFTDAASGDLTLDAGFSQCVDAGNPLSGYNDADGTRNDMGAFGGAGSEW